MNNNYIMLPLIAIKDIVILKGETITLDISKKKSIYALESVLDEEKEICLVLERENNEFNNIGTVVKINKYSDIMPTVTRIVV
nr:LON peptidase substrate-binding domain-containing protein [uncultured Tyzzerella sp.]